MKGMVQLSNIAKKIKRNFKAAVFFALCLALVVLFIKYFSYLPGWDFRNNLYLPVFLLVKNQSPYNIHILVDGSNAIWMPGVLGAFFPLGFLSLQQASNIWWLINFSALFVLIWISSNKKMPSIGKLIVVILLITFFPSSAAHFDLGQITILITLLLTVIIHFYHKMPVWLIGLIFAFTLSKPQLVVLFLPAFSLFILKNEGLRNLIHLWLWTALGLVVLSLPVFLFYPDWIPDLLANIQLNKDWAHPNLYNLFSISFNNFSWIFFAGFLTLGLSISGWIILKTSEISRFYWILAITPIFSPYIWSWDFILAYPLLVYLIFNQPSKRRSWMLLVSGFMVFILFMIQKIMGIVAEFTTIWVPFALILLLFVFRSDKEGGIENENAN